MNQPNNLPGAFTENEGRKIAELAENKICLEIGSLFGRSSSFIASTAKKLFCIDLFEVGFNFNNVDLSFSTVETFIKNTSRFNNIIPIISKSDNVPLIICNDCFDLIFIDAGHEYKDVMTDITNWLPKLKKGGIMAFHDYANPDYPGVQKAVEEKFEISGKVDYLAWAVK